MAGLTTKASGLRSATTIVDVASATAPSANQVLTATSSTAATWQTPSASAGIGWALKSYTTAAAATSITVSSLDLATDLVYKIIIRARNGNAGHIRIKFNSDTATTIYRTRWGFDGNLNVTIGNSGSGTAPYEISPVTADAHSWELEMYRQQFSSTTARTTLSGLGNGAETTKLNYGANVSMNFAGTANITSLTFDSSVNHDWDVWVYTHKTS